MRKQIQFLLIILLLFIITNGCGKNNNQLPVKTTPITPSSAKKPLDKNLPMAPIPNVKGEKQTSSDLLQGNSSTQEYYSSSGRRDPFKPFEGGEITYTAISKAPLERFELNQLELTAIVWGIARPKVLFQAPDGYSYIGQVGTGIGRNRGKITKITKNRVLVNEEFRDTSGQYVPRESEFVMEADQKSDKLFQELGMKYSDE